MSHVTGSNEHAANEQQASSHEAFLAQVADIKLLFDGKRLYAQAAVLAEHSNVLLELFKSTPRESWSSGVQEAFSGYALADIQMYLALHKMYIPVSDVRKEYDTDRNTKLRGLIDLAHKLDAKFILQAIEGHLLETDCAWEYNVPIPAGLDDEIADWLDFAREYGLPRLAKTSEKKLYRLLCLIPFTIKQLPTSMRSLNGQNVAKALFAALQESKYQYQQLRYKLHDLFFPETGQPSYDYINLKEEDSYMPKEYLQYEELAAALRVHDVFESGKKRPDFIDGIVDKLND